MTATPALSNDIFGRYQKKISDAFYLDHKESEYIHSELRAFALEVLATSTNWEYYTKHFATDSDPGDENAG